MDVRLPDGTIIRGVPEGTTREDVLAFAKSKGIRIDEPKEKGVVQKAAEGARDFGAGLVRGAGSIGATLLAPIDVAKDALDGKGLSLESNRKRRGDMDEFMRDVAGADTDSLAYGGGKLVTEVAGTLGVGGAAANATARVAPTVAAKVPGLINAVRTGGFSTGARVAPGFVPQAANLGTRVAGGAINGGLAAGLVNPEDADVGALVGGAIPVVTRVAGAAGRTVGNAVSPKFAKNNATSKIAATLGDDVNQAVADIQTYYPAGAENIPVSSAAATGNPKLAVMEQGSRVKGSPAWYDLDQRQGKAVFDNVLKATDEAGELGQRLGERAENWRTAWTKAAENQKPRLWQRRMTQFGADLETALKSPDASNPSVRGVLDAINAEFDRVGPNFSLGHLQQLRANLNGKVNPMSPDVFKSVPRDNPAIKSLIAEMDDILNTSTGGKWQKVIEGYAKDSEKVRAAKAASKVRGAFVDDATGRARGVALDPNGDVPKITQAGLNGALDAARMPDKSLALSSGALDRLEATLKVLQRQGIVQGVKRTATAGGGSDTIPNAIAAGAQSAGTPSLLLQLITGVKKLGTAKTENALAELLSNPNELAKALSSLQAPVAPNRVAAALSRATPVLVADQ
jgi:hypothetical protein